jgi:hypothetical protein
MTNEEAKFILGAYRANGRDADTALFNEALRQARTDPSLGEWLARAQAHDAAVGAKLREVAPPAGLREAILAGARVSKAPRSSWKTSAPWFALAACLAIITTVSVLLRPIHASGEVVRFARFAVDDTLNSKHGGHGPASGELAALLGQSTTHLAAGLPIDVSTFEANGCRTVRFAGRDVLEVCFKRNGAWFHCYIANRADFPNLAAQTRVEFSERAKLGSAAWADATHMIVVVGEGGLEAVKRLL